MAALTISSPAIVAAPVTTPTAAALAILLPATADVTAPTGCSSNSASSCARTRCDTCYRTSNECKNTSTMDSFFFAEKFLREIFYLF